MEPRGLLGRSPYPAPLHVTLYNHAFALLRISPSQIEVDYYQYPSWVPDAPPPQVPGPDKVALLHTEIIPRR